jgi:hypothetical protein
MATAPLQYHAGVVHAHDRVIYIIFSYSVVGSVAGERVVVIIIMLNIRSVTGVVLATKYSP